MAKYHVNPETGNPGVCRAKIKCKFGDMDSEHYSTMEEAREAYEAKRDSVPKKLSKGSKVRANDIPPMSILPTNHQQEYLQSDAFYNVNGVVDDEAIDNFTDYHYFKMMNKKGDNEELTELVAKYKFLNSDMGKNFHGYKYDSMYLLDGYTHEQIMGATIEKPKDNYERINEDFQESGVVRKKLSNEFYGHYSNETNKMLKNITPVQQNALAYWTSCGSSVTNGFVYGDGTNPWGIQNDDPEDEDYFNHEEYLKVIDGAFDSMPVGKEKILYRGLKREILGDDIANEKFVSKREEKIDAWLDENCKIGTELEFKTPLSTSAASDKAKGFAQSGIVYEIKSKKNLPVGGLSAWGYSETEYLTPRNAKYKVVAVLKDVPYENYRGESTSPMTVIQLEQIDD